MRYFDPRTWAWNQDVDPFRVKFLLLISILQLLPQDHFTRNLAHPKFHFSPPLFTRLQFKTGKQFKNGKDLQVFTVKSLAPKKDRISKEPVVRCHQKITHKIRFQPRRRDKVLLVCTRQNSPSLALRKYKSDTFSTVALFRVSLASGA